MTDSTRRGHALTHSAEVPASTASGYVMLLGKEVHNAGEISTPKGQALLAALRAEGMSALWVRRPGSQGWMQV